MRPFISGARASIIPSQQSTKSTTDVAAAMRLHLSCLFFLFRLHANIHFQFGEFRLNFANLRAVRAKQAQINNAGHAYSARRDL